MVLEYQAGSPGTMNQGRTQDKSRGTAWQDSMDSILDFLGGKIEA
jgi:hypothetical protein